MEKKYVDDQGVTKIGTYLKANKTAIDGALETVNTLNGKVSEIETNLTVIDPQKVIEALEEGYNAN